LHQQNPPVLDWRFQLTQVDLYNSHKMVVVVVVVVVISVNYCTCLYLKIWDTCYSAVVLKVLNVIWNYEN